jgi:hypothetical protein
VYGQGFEEIWVEQKSRSIKIARRPRASQVIMGTCDRGRSSMKSVEHKLLGNSC